MRCPLCIDMPSLLGRDLTTDEQSVRTSLTTVLRGYGRIQASKASIRDLAAGSPEGFFAAAMSLLESLQEPLARQSLYAHLLECPEFLVQLTRPDRFSRAELVVVCRELMAIDGLLDVRLAHLAPGRQDDKSGLGTEAVLHVLDVLDQISPGPRLIVILTHLTHHAEQRIAAKATLLLGRRVRNDHWLENHLASDDARVRASVVEALWGINTYSARKIMVACLKDVNNRVVGNALVGLHMLGDHSVIALVREMLRDRRPSFRWTAAWVMGYMGSTDFVECLREALSDPESGVRQAARRALVAIRQIVVKREREAAEAAAAVAAAAAAAEQAALAAQSPVAVAVEEAPEPQAETVSETPATTSAPAVPQAPAKPKSPVPAVPLKKKDDAEPEDDGFDLHLDGRYISRR